MRRFLLPFIFCLSCLNVHAQYISYDDNGGTFGSRYQDTHIEGYLDGQLYYGDINDFLVVYLKSSREYFISADCGERLLEISVKYDHEDNGVNFYGGKCRITEYSAETGEETGFSMADVIVMTQTGLRWFTAHYGMDKAEADSLYSGKRRFYGSRFAIRLMLDGKLLAFVPIVDDNENNIVEYNEDNFPLIPKDSTMKISRFCHSLYSGLDMRMQAVADGILKDYAEKGIAVTVSDSLSIDSDGNTLHHLKAVRFIPEDKELEERLLDTLGKIQFRPVELRPYPSDSGNLINVYDVFSLNVIYPTANPKFKGGDAKSFSIWVNERLRYPEECRRSYIEGKVLLKFAIGEDGRVADLEVLESAHPLFAEEASRVVLSSPKWSPAKVGDINIRTSYTFPVYFYLRN